MKSKESTVLPAALLSQTQAIGERIARLRQARRVLQSEAALRAGLSRPTAGKIEAGDPGRSLSQVLRYLEAIAPGLTLLQLLQESDPSLAALAASEKTRRVRKLSGAELESLDF